MTQELIAREDMFEVSITVDGRDLGVWEKRSGGAGDSEDTKVRRGGLRGQASIGGPQTRENITAKKLFDLKADAVALYLWLDARRGKGDVTVNNQPLDRDGNSFGDGWTNTGILKQVTPPDVDADSNDAAYLEIEIGSDGDAA